MITLKKSSFYVLSELNYCEKNPDTCKNDAKCISLTKDDGNFKCLCREGSSGQYCEHSKIHTVKPITSKPPAVIPLSPEIDATNNTATENEESFPKETTTLSVPITKTTTEKVEPIISDNET